MCYLFKMREWSLFGKVAITQLERIIGVNNKKKINP
jgi:hypothetical protein